MLTARSKRWYGGDVAVIDNGGTRPLVLRHGHLPFYFDKVTLTGTFPSKFAADGRGRRARNYLGETACTAPGATSPLDVRIACRPNGTPGHSGLGGAK